MKNKGMIGKCLILIGVLMIAAGSVLFAMDKDKYFKDDKKGDSNSGNVKPDTPDKPDNPGNPSNPSNVGTRCSGIFEKEGAILKLYPRGEFVALSLDSDISSFSSSDGTVNDDLIVLDFSEQLSIKCEDDKAIVTYGESEISGDYNKISEYTKEEFFRDNYGDPSYLDGKYNFQFGNDATVINMFKNDSQNVYADIKYSSGSNILGYTSDFTIQSDGSMISRIFDEEVTLILSDEKLIIQVKSSNPDSSYLVLNGEYNKIKTLSMDDIINNISI